MNKLEKYLKPKITKTKLGTKLFSYNGYSIVDEGLLLAGTDCQCGKPLCLPCSGSNCC